MAEGRIELESGAWRWRVDDLALATEAYGAGRRPEGDVDPDVEGDGEEVERPDRPSLFLEDPDDPEHWMARALPDGRVDPSEDELRELAREPDLRQIRDEDGSLWRLEPVDKPESVLEDVAFERSSVKVKVSREGGPERVVSLPDGGMLGTVPREGLLQAIHA